MKYSLSNFILLIISVYLFSNTNYQVFSGTNKNDDFFIKNENLANDITNAQSSNSDIETNNNNEIEVLLEKENREILSDWLHISSKHFLDKKIFPSLILPDNKEISLNLDKNNFRINEFFNPYDNDSPPDKTSFWFRLSGKMLYYSIYKNDMSILGSIIIKELKETELFKPIGYDYFCFMIIDILNMEWKICANSIDQQIKWMCKILNNINKKIDNCQQVLLKKEQNFNRNKRSLNKEIPEERDKVEKPIILIPIPAANCNESWDYRKNGLDWECDCKNGKEQSPINLPDPQKAILSSEKPLFQYDEIFPNFSVTGADGQILTNQNLNIIFDKNLIKIKHKSFGRIIYNKRFVFEATEIVFHSSSEHKLNGKFYEMEMQIIHEGITKDNENNKIILSFLFERKPGAYNQFIEDLDYFNLPNYRNPQREIKNKIYIPKIFYSLESEDLTIMKPFSFFTYQGSLTTPPCTENVTYFVASEPVSLSSTAIQMFAEAIRVSENETKSLQESFNCSFNTSSNNRMTQNINERKIYFFDHIKFVGPDPYTKKQKQKGHYEKIEKQSIEYYHVDSDKPTDLPFSFIIPEFEKDYQLNKKQELQDQFDC